MQHAAADHGLDPGVMGTYRVELGNTKFCHENFMLAPCCETYVPLPGLQVAFYTKRHAFSSAPRDAGAGVLIDHARVSTGDQKFDLRRDARAQFCCHRMFEDPPRRKYRRGVVAAILHPRRGDTLAIYWRLPPIGGGRSPT